MQYLRKEHEVGFSLMLAAVVFLPDQYHEVCEEIEEANHGSADPEGQADAASVVRHQFDRRTGCGSGSHDRDHLEEQQ